MANEIEINTKIICKMMNDQPADLKEVFFYLFQKAHHQGQLFSLSNYDKRFSLNNFLKQHNLKIR